MTGHEHPLPDSLLIPAVLHQRGMPLSDVNEGDMKGLTEKKPGGKRVIHAHSYSLFRNCCILTNIHTHTHTSTFVCMRFCRHINENAHAHRKNGEVRTGHFQCIQFYIYHTSNS